MLELPDMDIPNCVEYNLECCNYPIWIFQIVSVHTPGDDLAQEEAIH